MRSFFRKLFYIALVIFAVSIVFGKRFGGFNFFSSSSEQEESHAGAFELESEGTPFTRIDISGNFLVKLRADDQPAYAVKASGNHKDKIKAYIEGETLYISYKGKNWLSQGFSKQVEVHIQAPELERIEAHGALRLESENTLKVDELDIHVSGASEADLNIHVDYLDLRASGASDIDLKGKAQECKLQVSGAGEIDAEELKTEDMDVSISGAGEARVYVTDALDVKVSGAGSVKYTGNPKNISQSISGAGSVKSR
ncbi:MAG: head GIN domain-containing protein [Bacteroidota bacterium]